MYPPQNPPPECPERTREPVDILPFWTAPMFGGSCSRLQALALYCLCGALISVGIGCLAFAIEYAFRWDEWSRQAALRNGLFGELGFDWEIIEPEFRSEDFIGWTVGLFCAGIPSGSFLWLVVAVWRAARLPIRAAAVCVSLGGTLALCNTASRLVEQRENSHGFIRTIIAIAIVTCLCGLFGYVHALAVRRGISWLEARQERSSPISI